MTETPDPVVAPTLQSMDGDAPDELLQLVAFLAQEKDITGVPLTLGVSGQLITGSVVGRDAWFQEMKERADAEGPALAPLVEGLGRFASPPDDAEDDGGHAQYGYLHLRDARFIVGQALTRAGNLWRIRIASIDSWAFGMLNGS